MARARMLSTAISQSEQMADLPDDMCRVIATWTLAHLDREGRVTGSPRRLRSLVVPLLPYTDTDVLRAIKAMSAGPDPMAVYYADASGQAVLWFPKFLQYQSPAALARESKSRFGAPPADACDSMQSHESPSTRALASLDLTSVPPPPPDPDARAKPPETDHAAIAAALVELCPSFALDADRLVPLWVKTWKGLDLVQLASVAHAELTGRGEAIHKPAQFFLAVFKKAFTDKQAASAAAHDEEHGKRKAAELAEARLLKQFTPPANPVPIAEATARLKAALSGKGEAK